MPDPSILALIQHVNFTPPAIVEPAPEVIRFDLVAFERHVEERERIVADWIDEGVALRAQLWTLAQAGSTELTPTTLSELIGRQDEALKGQLRIAKRYKKAVAQSEKGLKPDVARRVRQLHDRVGAAIESFYDEGRDLALFLRALRAEVDPDSRGGPTFSSGDDLEGYLLAKVG